jgi:hypothetical protein
MSRCSLDFIWNLKVKLCEFVYLCLAFQCLDFTYFLLLLLYIYILYIPTTKFWIFKKGIFVRKKFMIIKPILKRLGFL